ncbi:MAG: CapA family protein [Ruminococcaceae bacterium]|nr:CapA family protein [Oscillospiraceae bacterium]
MKLIFTGDVNFRNKENITAEESRKALRQVMPYFNAADFRIVNLECPLSDDDSAPIRKSGPNLISPKNCICFLDEGKVDAATLANNHIGDYGDQPIIDTLNLLREHGIKYSGAGANIEEAYKAMYLEKDGIKVAIISSCENEFGIADINKYGSAGLNIKRMYAAIKREKEIADFVIVAFHGGNEQNPIPSPAQVERYRLFCDFGADAVIAGHTHCPQPAEYYNGKPIIYSMGNFFFSSFTEREANDPWFYGYMVNLEIAKGETIKYELIPYRAEDSVSVIHVFEGEEKKTMLDYLDNLAKKITEPLEHRKYFKGWCYHIETYWADNPNKEGGLERLVPSKNVVNCEAHHELIVTNYCRMIDGEDELAKEYWEKVRRLMIMPV